MVFFADDDDGSSRPQVGASIYDIRTGGGGGVKNADKQNINIADKGGGGRKVQNKLWTSYMEALQARSLRCSVFIPRENIYRRNEKSDQNLKRHRYKCPLARGNGISDGIGGRIEIV